MFLVRLFGEVLFGQVLFGVVEIWISLIVFGSMGMGNRFRYGKS